MRGANKKNANLQIYFYLLTYLLTIQLQRTQTWDIVTSST